jgi:peptide/nickel transport system permease protein
MLRFVVRRGISAILLLFAVSVVVFAIFEVIPNYNPAQAIAGRNATPTTVAEVSRKFGFDKPIYIQYLDTMKLIFTGQVIDYQDNLNVVGQFQQRFGVTVSLVVPAAVFWLLAAIVLGSVSALRIGGMLVDRGIMAAAILGVSVPVFLLAAVLLYLFAFKLGWFPNTGYTPFLDSPAQWAYHLVLPWFAIAVLSVGFYSRVLRSNLLDMVNQDFVRTAKAKGLPARQVFVKHVLRNSLLPIITMFGLDFATLLGGAALVTETVFNLPGVGQYEAAAIGNLDVPPILVGALFTAFFVVLFSALSDIVYALLDPRIRLTG